MAIKTQSAKVKGRKLQQFVRDSILKRFEELESDDVRSTSMGAGGEDVQLSPSARKLFPFSVECKNRAKIALYKDYEQAKGNCPKDAEPLLVIKQDRSKPLVVIDAEYFFDLMRGGRNED